MLRTDDFLNNFRQMFFFRNTVTHSEKLVHLCNILAKVSQLYHEGPNPLMVKLLCMQIQNHDKLHSKQCYSDVYLMFMECLLL